MFRHCLRRKLPFASRALLIVFVFLPVPDIFPRFWWTEHLILEGRFTPCYVHRYFMAADAKAASDVVAHLLISYVYTISYGLTLSLW